MIYEVAGNALYTEPARVSGTSSSCAGARMFRVCQFFQVLHTRFFREVDEGIWLLFAVPLTVEVCIIWDGTHVHQPLGAAGWGDADSCDGAWLSVSSRGRIDRF